jgi:hypothetical protein
VYINSFSRTTIVVTYKERHVETTIQKAVSCEFKGGRLVVGLVDCIAISTPQQQHNRDDPLP